VSWPGRPRGVPGAARAPLRRAPRRAPENPPLPRSRSAISCARALYGAALLLAPRRALGVPGDAIEARLRAFARVLGARNLLEAAILRRHPTRAWAIGGAAVDAAHAASMLLLASLDRRRRAVALRSALAAGALAAWGVGSARKAPPGREHSTRRLSRTTGRERRSEPPFARPRRRAGQRRGLLRARTR
jgi:hypothetical protein